MAVSRTSRPDLGTAIAWLLGLGDCNLAAQRLPSQYQAPDVEGQMWAASKPESSNRQSEEHSDEAIPNIQEEIASLRSQ